MTQKMTSLSAKQVHTWTWGHFCSFVVGHYKKYVAIVWMSKDDTLQSFSLLFFFYVCHLWGHSQHDETNRELVCQQQPDVDQIRRADRETAVAEWKQVTAESAVEGGLWRPEASHMTSAPMMRLYADACVRIQYVHEEARLRVHYKQDHCICVRGFVIWLQRTQRDTLKAAAGSLFGSNHDRQTCHADLFFFLSSPYSFSRCPTQTHSPMSHWALQDCRESVERSSSSLQHKAYTLTQKKHTRNVALIIGCSWSTVGSISSDLFVDDLFGLSLEVKSE